MRRFVGRRALALVAVPLILALLGVTLFRSVRFAAASAVPTVTVTGDPAPGNTVMVTGENWPSEDTINITYDGAALATAVVRIHSSTVGPLGSGAFNVGVQIPVNTTTGAHTIAATDPRTGATAQLTISVMAEWAQFGFSSANTRYNPYETAIGVGNVATLTPAWTYQATGGQCTVPGVVMPSVAQGNIIFTNQEYCQLISLNAATGAVNWTAANYYLTSDAQPVVADGAIFDEAGYLLANSFSTGASLWQSAYQRYQVSPVAANGMIYATGHWNNLVGGYSLEAYPAGGCGQATCAPLWSYSQSGGSEITTAVASGSVYFADFDLGSGNGLLAVDSAKGKLQWSGAVGSDQEVYETMADNGYVILTANIPQGYPGSPGGTLYAFNAAGCGLPTCQPLWTAYDAAGWGNAPAVANGVIYVGGKDGALYAFNEAGCGQATCAPLWKSVSLSQTTTAPVAAPAVANGVVYYTSGPTGEALAFNAAGCGAATCSPLWSYTLGLGSSVTSNAPPVIVNGMLYVSASDNVLYAFHLPATASKGSASQASPTGSGGVPTRTRTDTVSSATPAALVSGWLAFRLIM